MALNGLNLKDLSEEPNDRRLINLTSFMPQQTHGGQYKESVKAQNLVVIIPHMDNSTILQV